MFQILHDSEQTFKVLGQVELTKFLYWCCPTTSLSTTHLMPCSPLPHTAVPQARQTEQAEELSSACGLSTSGVYSLAWAELGLVGDQHGLAVVHSLGLHPLLSDIVIF